MERYQIIERLAREIGASGPVRRKWRERRSVPHRWRLPLLEAAEKRGIEIDRAAFDDYRARPLGRAERLETSPHPRPAPSRARPRRRRAEAGA